MTTVEQVKSGPLTFKKSLERPYDLAFQAYKQAKKRELMRYSVKELEQMLRIQQQQPAPIDETGGELTKELIGGLQSPTVAPLTKNVLGSASGSGLTDGSPLIRQDLESIVETLFVKTFPLYETIRKVPGNGLTHAFDVMTTPDSNMSATSNTVSTLITELATVSFTASTYQRKTTTISLFGVGRGVSFLETAAVRGGGMAFDPLKMELAGGVTKIAYDIQTLVCQGNGSYASGTSSNEGGAYTTSPAPYDGLRLILGSVTGSNYASNNATQMEQGTINLTQTIRKALGQAAQLGGMPDLVVGTINAKTALDEENETNKRYNDVVEVVPGVQVNQLAWANGIANILAVPGFSFGTYTSPLSSQTVEDVYFLQTDQIEMPWLYNEGINVLELPAAVDYTLSQRYIVFHMVGLAVKAPLFMGKIRRIAS